MVEKVYIAGKITGEPNFKDIFNFKKEELSKQNKIVLNPAELPKGLEYEEYMEICFSMIRVCDCVHFLENWKDSKGAIREYHYAVSQNKKISLPF